MASLQDQLLQAGLVDKKQAKDISKQKRKQAKQPKGQARVAEARVQARQALAERAERDRESNRQLQLEAAHKAIRAQIIQLIRLNRIDRKGGELGYQFVDGKKIKKIHVSSRLQQQLTDGMIAIVKLHDQYELVPAAVAEKIAQRDEAVVLLHNADVAGGSATDADDPYADYQIPDDLMW